MFFAIRIFMLKFLKVSESFFLLLFYCPRLFFILAFLSLYLSLMFSSTRSLSFIFFFFSSLSRCFLFVFRFFPLCLLLSHLSLTSLLSFLSTFLSYLLLSLCLLLSYLLQFFLCLLHCIRLLHLLIPCRGFSPLSPLSSSFWALSFAFSSTSCLSYCILLLLCLLIGHLL